MKETRGPSRRTFVRRAAVGGAALAGGGLAYAVLKGQTGPDYPDVESPGLEPLPGFNGTPPNIILINADDLGFGDLSCYGSPAISTPNIDSLARDGVRFTDFHTCDAVCTPSRAGLLTGRYPVRMGLDTPLHPQGAPLGRKALLQLGYVLGRVGLLDLASHRASHGLHPAEMTMAEALKAGGYRTGMVGKWHLGDFTHDPAFNPVRHGFDSYLGVPYSNDMDPLPLLRDEEMVEPHVQDQAVLTGLYTAEAQAFMTSAAPGPFFLYLAHTFPHRPLAASSEFRGSSEAGLYGDTVREIDWSVGEILATLQALGLTENTLVLFTSDNGPWYQGSPGRYRGRKGQAFEGGHRVPFLARAPGLIPPGSECQALASNLDLFPTCLALAGLAPPADRTTDGADIAGLLTGETEESPHGVLYLYHQGELEGVRAGDWKYLRDTSHYTWPMPANKKLGHLSDHTEGPLPLLHDLATDPGEAYNLADRYPDVVARLEAALATWESELEANRLGFHPASP